MSGKKEKPAAKPKKVIPGFTPVVEGTSHTSLKEAPKKTFNEARKEKKRLLQNNKKFSGNSNNFKTDSEVTGNRDLKERKLVKWSANEDESNNDLYQSLEDLSVTHEKFDQFEANRKQFQIESNYDESFYNVQIDKNNQDYKKKMDAAIKLESEILKDPSMNLKTGNQHIDEERGLVDMKEDVDEESKYSQVVLNEKYPEPIVTTPSPISKKTFSGAQLLKSIQKPQSPISPSGIGRDISPGNDVNFNKSTVLKPRNGKKIISKLHLKGKDETVKELQAFSKSFQIPERLNKSSKVELQDSKSFFDFELNPFALSSDLTVETSKDYKIFDYFKNIPHDKSIPKSFASQVVFNNQSTKKYKQILNNSSYFKRRLSKYKSSFYQPYPNMDGHPSFFAPMNAVPRNGSFSMNAAPPQMVQMPMFLPPQASMPDQSPNSQLNSRSGSFNMTPQFNAQAGMYMPPVNYYVQMPMMPMPVMMGNAPSPNKKFQGQYVNKKKTYSKTNKQGNKKGETNSSSRENKK